MDIYRALYAAKTAYKLSLVLLLIAQNNDLIALPDDSTEQG